MTTVILVRHGQTAWNVKERFRGREDVPLDEVGVRQAERTAERIARQWAPGGGVLQSAGTGDLDGRGARAAQRI